MIEKLIALKLPPGMANNGTTYQQKNRWISGSLVRFFQGSVQPIGGWVQRSLVGVAIVGTPNAMIGWQRNDGTSWLAVGTTTNLYVVSSANVVSDITPTSGFALAGNPATWQLDTFGAYLVATYNGAGTNVAGACNVFTWTGDPSFAAQPVGNAITAPIFNYGVVTTPERFLMLLRGSDPATLSAGHPTQQNERAAKAGAIASALVD